MKQETIHSADEQQHRAQGECDPEQAAEEETAQEPVDQREQLIAELEQRMIRLHADFDNYRKRTQREREEQAIWVEAELVRKLLPVLDNFERALEAMPEEQSWAEGVKLVYRQLLDVLTQQGLTLTDCGQPFDPNLHEAVMRDDSGTEPDGTILQELQRGYQYKGKLLRPSMVKVANRS